MWSQPNFYGLFKPRSSLLLTYTGLSAYMYSAGNTNTYSLLLFIILGVLATMSANSLNNYFDRDIDASMSRTRNRPLPSGLIPAAYAPLLGIPMIIISVISFILWFNPLSALLVLFGCTYYVVFYTLYLKRRTSLNTVIGGLSGVIPPLAGWAAATGGLGVGAVLLGATIFFWTPSHFWCLSIRFRDDYVRTGIPMLPSQTGLATSIRWIIIFNLLTAASITVSTLFFDSLVYRVSALAALALIIASSLLLHRKQDDTSAWHAYKMSSPILIIIFTGVLLSLLTF
ncbi:MAG: heme o synthase [Thaumarchaeota archaeon]|nr:heme o synthase [Nitrososphaerota archaeon]MCL5317303.1 heme o synthase [Nitrososphaerota archaeon]